VLNVDGKFSWFFCLLCLDFDTNNLFKRHFSGEESFDTGPMAPASEPGPSKTGTKL
jgi:hypothetical protein